MSRCACVQDEKFGSLLSGSLTQNYDAVIGSLPKGLTQDERLRIRESMPMSPALGALQQIPEVRGQAGERWWTSLAYVLLQHDDASKLILAECRHGKQPLLPRCPLVHREGGLEVLTDPG